jgi:hypothetical protein
LALLLLLLIGFEVIGFGDDNDRLKAGGFDCGVRSSPMLPGEIFRN